MMRHGSTEARRPGVSHQIRVQITHLIRHRATVLQMKKRRDTKMRAFWTHDGRIDLHTCTGSHVSSETEQINFVPRSIGHITEHASVRDLRAHRECW